MNFLELFQVHFNFCPTAISVTLSVTGCQGIIDSVELQAATDPSTLLSAIGIGRPSSGFN